MNVYRYVLYEYISLLIVVQCYISFLEGASALSVVVFLNLL